MIHGVFLKRNKQILFIFVAYQLRVCQPPPPVPNAEILTEDDEFEIGKVSKITFKEHTHSRTIFFKKKNLCTSTAACGLKGFIAIMKEGKPSKEE